MFSALVTGSNGRGLNTSRGHCVVLLRKTLYSHSASLTQARYKWVPANLTLGVPCDGLASHPGGWGRGSRNTTSRFMRQKPG